MQKAPNGWTDKSEHEDDELDYIFKLQGSDQRSVTIFKHEWRNETQWTLTGRKSNAIGDSYRLGQFADLDEAARTGETWLNG